MAAQPERLTGAIAPADRGSVDYTALVRDAAVGNRAAMEELLMRAQETAYRFSYLVCGHAEDAEDVMQEALLKTFQYVQRIDDPTAFRAWLYSTIRNACMMKRRRRAGEPAGFVPIEANGAGDEGRPTDVADRSARIDEQMVQAAVDARVRAALGRLPAAYRTIVVLRDIEGLSTRDVAAVTGYSEANVKQRLHRARMRLRRYLEAS